MDDFIADEIRRSITGGQTVELNQRTPWRKSVLWRATGWPVVLAVVAGLVAGVLIMLATYSAPARVMPLPVIVPGSCSTSSAL